MNNSANQLHISWSQIEGYCTDIVLQMIRDDWKPDIIVGVTRGGAIPAVIISHMLNVKMIGLDVSLYDSQHGPETNCWIAEDAAAGRKILIVDDINDRGNTINWIKKDWDSSVTADHSIEWGFSTRIAVVVDNESSKAEITPQYSGVTINKAVNDQWVVFPYEQFWKK